MRTYTVHEKRVPSAEIEERAGDLIFVKEGFSFWTLLFPPGWLLAHGLLGSLAVYLTLLIALVLAQAEFGLNVQIIGWAGLLIQFLFAFEARDLYRGALESRGYELIGVVSGRDYEEAERRFLQEWLPSLEREWQSSLPSPFGHTGVPDATGGSQAKLPVIGMFPSHGG